MVKLRHNLEEESDFLRVGVVVSQFIISILDSSPPEFASARRRSGVLRQSPRPLGPGQGRPRRHSAVRKSSFLHGAVVGAPSSPRVQNYYVQPCCYGISIQYPYTGDVRDAGDPEHYRPQKQSNDRPLKSRVNLERQYESPFYGPLCRENGT